MFLAESHSRIPMTGPAVHWDVGRHLDEEPQYFAGFVTGRRFGNFKDTRSSFAGPNPYGGDLRAAEIIVLLLNPGFGFTDYYGETPVPEFRHRLEKTLEQDFTETDFRFIRLDPQYCWHGGFFWWERKLRDVMVLIAEKKFGGRYFDAPRDMS